MIYLSVIIGILACSLSQLLLKKSANNTHRAKIYELLNPWVCLAYGMFLISMLVNIWAMSNGLKLKEMAMLESLGYVFVPLLSVIVLKEQMTRRTILAVFVILSGIIIFYL